MNVLKAQISQLITHILLKVALVAYQSPQIIADLQKTILLSKS